jgi:phosphoglycerate dehydrogenase-like enzyme
LAASAVEMTEPVIVVLSAGDPPPGLSEHVCGAVVRMATAAELPSALGGADVLLAWDFTSDAVAEAWACADRLRWVHTASAGVDRLTFPELLRSEVTLTNSRGIFDAPIAEYVLGLVIAFAKDFAGTWRLQQSRRWQHRETERVAGSVAVVVGSGPIGRAIGATLAGVGMRVQLTGRTEKTGDPDFGTVYGAEAVPELLPQADYVVLAAPLTEQTRGMIDARTLAVMKPTTRLINVGRGPLVVTDDLISALQAGQLAGAALDVFETEPLPAESCLWELPQVVVSPHMSADTVGWHTELVELFADNLDRYRTSRPLRNVVDKTCGYVRAGGGS